jgi:hypothetical protein
MALCRKLHLAKMRPNPSIEGMPKRLRLLCTPHVKRYPSASGLGNHAPAWLVCPSPCGPANTRPLSGGADSTAVANNVGHGEGSVNRWPQSSHCVSRRASATLVPNSASCSLFAKFHRVGIWLTLPSRGQSGTPGKAGGLVLLAPQRGKKLESPEGDITRPV